MVRAINPKILNILSDPAEAAETTIAVASTGVAFSRHFLMPKGVSFSWDLQFTSTAPDVKVELEQSNEEPTAPTSPAADVKYIIPDGKVSSELSAQINDELRHLIAYSPVVSAYGRLKLTGIGSNNADTVLSRARMIYIKNN